MFCQIIPDKLLKRLGDKKSIETSKQLRFSRNRFIRSLFGKKLSNEPHEHRLTYNCYNTTTLPGKLIITDSEKRPFLDKTVSKAHEGADAVFKFYWDLFGRDSLDDKGLSIISSVNYDKNYNNAFFSGQQMCYGSGDGKFFIPLVNAIDVIGHELTHGVIQYTCNLVYYHQPGALNESFADIFGITLKQYTLKQSDPKVANWLIGDSIIGPDFPGKALRSFKDEKAYEDDDQPKHMKDFVWTHEDNFGVHCNSGIANRAFYELCLLLDCPSYEKPIKIMYETLLNICSIADFKTVANMAIKQAKLLYDQPTADAVKLAYQKVGIL